MGIRGVGERSIRIRRGRIRGRCLRDARARLRAQRIGERVMDQQLLMSLLAARNGGTLPEGAEDPQTMLGRRAQKTPTVARIFQMMEAQKPAAAAREPLVIEAPAP